MDEYKVATNRDSHWVRLPKEFIGRMMVMLLNCSSLLKTVESIIGLIFYLLPLPCTCQEEVRSLAYLFL